MDFTKGFKSIAGKLSGAAPAAKALGQKAADRAALNAGAKYIDIGTPSQKFNPSGFLPKSAK